TVGRPQNALAVGKQLAGLTFQVGCDLRTSQTLALSLGALQPRLHTLADHGSLELGKCTRHLKHEPAGRSRRVDVLLLKEQVYAAGRELLNRAEKIDQRPS